MANAVERARDQRNPKHECIKRAHALKSYLIKWFRSVVQSSNGVHLIYNIPEKDREETKNDCKRNKIES